MIVVGIDPGKSGGLVALRAPLEVVEWQRTESFLAGKDYRVGAMARALRDLAPDLVAIERQHAMPKQGLTSTFSIARGLGLWEGIAAALGVPYEIVSAQTWQREVLRGVPGEGKVRAILAVEQRLPALELVAPRCRKPHEGLADAACIALWAIATHGAGRAAA